MFGIRLRKHHQLRVGRITLQIGVILHEIVDFLVIECQAEIRVCSDQRAAPLYR